ncbi:MAG: hypothetical protein E7626_02375 [Ruminococcaceae bacterium]|nr:hypothetical protein [Oscillospiraceae bacterium]
MKTPEKQNKKPKKEKIIYIDDGSTVVDMSALDESKRLFKKKDPDKRPRPKVIEHLKTYFESVKVMILPMLVVIGLISVAFFLLWLLMGGFQSLF